MSVQSISECQICGANFAEFITAKEEMYGMNGSFQYGRCSDCKCLQCVNPPPDLSAFYPENYYSFTEKKRRSFIKKFRRGLKRRLVLIHPSFMTPFMRKWLNKYEIFWAYRISGLKLSDKFLDVGSGSGEHILELREAGVANAIGIDPFLKADIFHEEALLVKKASLSEMANKFDYIAFNHSLEHINDQFGALSDAKKILNKQGKILVRIPTVDSDAYDKYREKWFQLDAPRHLFLHSHGSIAKVADEVGLRVEGLWCDSNELQYAISEEYQRGISLSSSQSYSKNKNGSVFSKKEISNFRKMSSVANKNLRGDQICVVLSHKVDENRDVQTNFD